jgi:acyl-homoserine-lactone acylase
MRLPKGVLLVCFLLSFLFLDGTAVLRAEPALVRRDRFGIPHILAESEQAAAFAHGYVAAEDHGDLMARLYLRAEGRQAEFFGEQFIEEDVLIRQLEVRAGAESDLAKLPPMLREILNQYASGYNLYLKQKGSPAFARPITPVDILAHLRVVLLVDFGMASSVAQSIKEKPGSNMWALGRGKTASNRGILLANPHLSWTGAFTLHEVQIRVTGKRDIYGVTIVGSPIITIGFNPVLGWTHTVNQVDVSDVYRLAIDKNATDHYLYEGLSLPLRSEQLVLRVKTPSGIRTEERTLRWSHHGPILRMDGATAYALKTASLDGAPYFAQWYEMSRARNYEEFQQALKVHGLPIFNIGYADREGNVLFLYGGRVPIRRALFDWTAPVPGDTSDTEWLGVHPLSDLPQLLNPVGGYIQNCNEPPWFASAQQARRLESVPAYIVSGQINPRAQISLKMLGENDRFTLADVIRAKFNTTFPVAERLKGDLVKALDGSGRSDLKEAADVLRQWDCKADAESRGSVLFLRWWADYARTAKKLYREEWSLERPLITPTGLGDQERAIRSTEAAIEYLRARKWDLNIRWGDVHRMRRGKIDLPIGGGPMVLGCFRSLMFQPEPDSRFSPNFGDSFVLAVEFTDTPTAKAVLAYSQSSDPESSHYSDQSEIFAKGALRPVWFSEEDIAANLERSYRPALPVKSTSAASNDGK